jgi:probable HAF family extracellular repeat protein
LWQSDAGRTVDLHGFLPPGFQFSMAQAIDSNGNVVGYAHDGDPSRSHAFLWKRNVPEPEGSRGRNTRGC